VAIERGKPGSAKVRTSPARIRQVRQGDNPWYEVVLIEGRNRELRKMFEEVGHFVEKIRRVGYGPLVLDQEPGNLRELQPAELTALREAAEGKLRTPKSKELRRRNALDAAGLPTVAPRPTIHPRPAKPFAPKPFAERAAGPDSPRSARPAGDRPRKPFDKAKPFRPAAPGTGPAKYPAAKFASTGSAKPPFRRDEGDAAFTPRPPRPAWKKNDRPAPPPRFQAGPVGQDRPSTDRPRTGSAGTGRTGAGRSFGAKPAWNKAAPRSDRPAYQRPSAPRRDVPSRDEDLGPVRPPNLHIEEIQQSDRPTPSRARSSAPRPGAPQSYSDRPAGRPSAARPDADRAERPSRPFRSEGGLPRAFTTSSGKPRPGGARPSSKPGKSAGFKSSPPRSSGPGTRSSSPRGGPQGGIDRRTGSGYRPAPGGARSYARPSSASRPARPFTPRAEGTPGSPLPRTKKFGGGVARPSGPRSEGARGSGAGWKPKTRYGGPAKPGATRSKPRPGSSAKPSHRVKPGGKPGGKPRGKQRG
jgi:23S rRNA pseudouridine2605 synthase